MKQSLIRLGVNIDHVATVRNARGTHYPCPVKAAIYAEEAGADGITAHLREDRRHISDNDIKRLVSHIKCPLNLEMAATQEMCTIALEHKPHAVCLVPEKRAEKTTEGGLDLAGKVSFFKEFIQKLKPSNARISLFIDPDINQIDAAISLNIPVIELHTGAFAHAFISGNIEQTHIELEALIKSAQYAGDNGLEIHAGHGLTRDMIDHIVTIPYLAELNIGHSLISEALFTGIKTAIRTMKLTISDAHAAL